MTDTILNLTNRKIVNPFQPKGAKIVIDANFETGAMNYQCEPPIPNLVVIQILSQAINAICVQTAKIESMLVRPGHSEAVTNIKEDENGQKKNSDN